MDSGADFDVAIIGAGAAGLAAGIYASRAGLNAILLEGSVAGGQANYSPDIPNYPGFPSIPGMELMDRMREHAQRYIEIRENDEVTSIVRGERFTVGTRGSKYSTLAVILTTGAKHRKLGVPGEDRLSGKGVSYCATCDGFFFKDKRAFVIGGGNTALIEAIYLLSVGAKVTLVHRRDSLRAEKALEERFLEQGGEVIWESVVTEIAGENGVSEVRLRNTRDGSERSLGADGVFISIGIEPNNSLARGLGVELDEAGYVRVDGKMRTNVPGVYAAGDLVGGLMQIVTAVAEGAIAATSAFEQIREPYWKGER